MPDPTANKALAQYPLVTDKRKAAGQVGGSLLCCLLYWHKSRVETDGHHRF